MGHGLLFDVLKKVFALATLSRSMLLSWRLSSIFPAGASVLPSAAGRLQQRDDDPGAEDSSRGRRSSAPHSPADPATPATRSTSLGLSQEARSRHWM